MLGSDGEVKRPAPALLSNYWRARGRICRLPAPPIVTSQERAVDLLLQTRDR